MKITYWIITGLFSLLMSASAAAYLSAAPPIVEAFHHLGFPDYFRTLLGVAKGLGAVAILLPFVPRALKEWAYAGFAITFVSAVISHLASGDGLGKALAPIVFLALLAASHEIRRRLDSRAAAPAPRPLAV